MPQRRSRSASREVIGSYSSAAPRVAATTDGAGRLDPLLLLEDDNPFHASMLVYRAAEFAELFPPDLAAEYPAAAALVFALERE